MEFKTKLMPHQEKAVNKLSKLKVGALYMEQGTGKTRTTLEIGLYRFDQNKVDIILWLCPCSVKSNLREDILYHCGEIPQQIVIYGIESISRSDRLYLKLLELVNNCRCFLVVDESNLCKNKDTIRTSRIIELSKKCQYKIILNGTPVSKNEADMFAQWYIIDWRILGYKSYYSFAANHLEFKRVMLPNGTEIIDKNRIEKVLNIDYLTEKIAPYTYQIKKSECDIYLPAKNYFRQCYYLSFEQYNEYMYTHQEYLEKVQEFKPETIYKLFTALQHVVSGRYIISKPNQHMKTKAMFSYTDNPRMQKLHQIIEKNIDNEKCIIFAKYQSEIDDIALMLTELDKSFVMFTGKIRHRQRQENRLYFQNKCQFFLANKACGAYGLNLQYCHNVIYYSNDFDLGTRLQSEDRVHRIGQMHEVNIYDIYCPDTIDEFIIKCLDKKDNMVAAFKREINKWKERKYMDLQYEIISSATDKNFYLKLGPFFSSRSVRKEFDGYPLSNDDDWQWFVAENKGTVVGFIAIEPKGKENWDIHEGYVSPEYRGSGICKQLLKMATEYVDTLNQTMTLTVKTSFEDSLGKYGFYRTTLKGKLWVNMRRNKIEQKILE